MLYIFSSRFKCLFLLTVTVVLQIFQIEISEARPEYATRHGINRCTACHFSPSGGGIKNQYGKFYGAKGFQLSKFSQQDYLSADLRFVHYSPQDKSTTTRSGLFLMAGIVGGSIPISAEAPEKEVRLVLSHDVLSSANWDTYVRIQNYDDVETSWLPQHFVFGRFHAPFGLLQDEHRTYTKLQTLSDYNRKLEAGLMLSGQPFEPLHYDLALVNGEASGATLSPGGAELWGAVANLRFMSRSNWVPILLGASYKFYERPTGQDNPWAYAAYGVLSFERLTGGYLSADLLLEYAQAQYFNSGMQTNAGFPTDPSYKAAISDAKSEGLFAQLNYYIRPRLALQFKYESLELNKNFSADAYEKTGVGFKHDLPANTTIQMRVENAKVGQPNEKASPHHRSQDAIWAFVQFRI